ncbi:MAG TPA: hypothetical protein PL056_12055 [bacterium]|nr:hypothetical protein [bacterium]
MIKITLKESEKIEKIHLEFCKKIFDKNIGNFIKACDTETSWRPFLDFIVEGKNFERLIIGKQVELVKIIEEIKDCKLSFFDKNKKTDICENILKLFHFKSFYYGEKKKKKEKNKNNGDEESWGAYQYVKMLGIKTCPYCNLNYLTMIPRKGKGGGLTPDLDHFFPKSKHPYLALSLYNLIPSCSNCNSRLKRSEDAAELLNPFEGGFGEDFQFRTNLDDVESIYGAAYKIKQLNGEKDKFLIKINDIHELEKNGNESKKSFVKKVNNNKKIFKLEQQYEFHKDYVREILHKEMIYSKTRIEDLQDNFPDLFTENEVRRSLFSTYFEEKELHKRPLSKLTKDILNEFKIVK